MIAQGPPGELERDPLSIMGPFLAGAAAVTRDHPPAQPGPGGQITLEIADLYNLHDVTAAFPLQRLTALAGPSGAGKTALILDSLIPAAKALLTGSPLPGHVRRLDLGGIRQVVQVDASPIGQNARSTPATYSGTFDEIRRLFADSPYARRRRWKPGHFSFNTREGQCPTCRGLGHIDLDVQYLPDITEECPTCHGARFNDATLGVRVDGLTIADVLGLSVDEALERFAGQVPVAAALRPVSEVGLGYLRLGEPTPSLSGGESQRLRIASRLRSSQRGVLYVFDEPSTGLHPLDVATLVGVFDRLLDGRSHDHRHRPRSGPARRGRPPDRHGARRRPGRRAHPGGGDAGGRRADPGQRDRAVAGRAPGPAGRSRSLRSVRDQVFDSILNVRGLSHSETMTAVGVRNP